jgi:hypothetical protein
LRGERAPASNLKKTIKRKTSRPKRQSKIKTHF